MAPQSNDDTSDKGDPEDDFDSGPVLREVDDSLSGRFRSAVDPALTAGEGFSSLTHKASLFEANFENPLTPIPPAALLPRGVEVEFHHSGIPRAVLEKYSPARGGPAVDGDWPEELGQLLRKHGHIRWKRTFPAYRFSASEGSAAWEREERIALDRDRFITFYFPQNLDLARILEDLRGLPSVARAAPTPKLAPASPIADPLLGDSDQVNPNHFCKPDGCLQNQWYIFRCHVDQAWNLAPGGEGVVIADIDWGFNPNHEAIKRIEFRRNTIRDGNANPDDDQIVSDGDGISHGTAVLGLAGAAANNEGMVGVAFASDLWAIQAGKSLAPNLDHWVEAIDLVRERDSGTRRKVIILEIQTATQGNIEQSLMINAAIKDAIAAGVVVCVPAGNGRKNAGLSDDLTTAIPFTGSTLVGATKFNADSAVNERGESNFGDQIVVYAPGDVDNDVTCSPHANRGYRNGFGGTSGATAKVAGVVALMLQANQDLEPAQVRTILNQTGTSVHNDPTGRFLDANAAVLRALELAG